MGYDPTTSEEQALAYDLRVFYAAVVGRKMLAIEEAASARNYPEWLRNLHLTYGIVYSRVTKNREVIKQRYKAKRRFAIETIQKNSKAFFGKDKDAKAVGDIEEALLDLTYYVYRIMHMSNQFGNVKFIPGLQ